MRIAFTPLPPVTPANAPLTGRKVWTLIAPLVYRFEGLVDRVSPTGRVLYTTRGARYRWDAQALQYRAADGTVLRSFP